MKFIERLKNLVGYDQVNAVREDAGAEIDTLKAKVAELEGAVDDALFAGDPVKLEQLRADLSKAKDDLKLMERVREGLAVRAAEEQKKEEAAALDAAMEPARQARKDMEALTRRFLATADDAAKLALQIQEKQRLIDSANAMAHSHGRQDLHIDDLVQDVIALTGRPAPTNPAHGFVVPDIYPKRHPDGGVWLLWAQRTAKVA